MPSNPVLAARADAIVPDPTAPDSNDRSPETGDRPSAATGLRTRETSTPGLSTSFLGRAALFALITGVFGLLQIHQALDQGRLAFPATYDDTGYFRDALSRLHSVFDQGVVAFFRDWWTSPPKSPWSTLVAFAGFALFGPNDWSPAAANVGVLALMAVALAAVVRTLPGLPALGILVALLTWPYFGTLIVEFRPDMVWGIGSAALAAVVAAGATDPLSRRRILIAAALLALVLLTKVTTLPVSLAILATVCIATLAVRRISGRDTLRHHAMALAAIIGIAMLVALPHYAIGLGEIYRYVSTNVFGAQARIWELELTRSGHVMYHLTGPGGQTMMGAWLGLWLVTFALFAANLAYTRDRRMALRSACFAAGFAVAFAAVTVPAHKSPYIGAVVPAFFLVSWTLMNRRLLSPVQPASTRRLALAALVVVMGLGLFHFAWPSTIGHGLPSTDRYTEIAKRRADIADVTAALDRARFNNGEVFVVGATPYLNADTLHYYAVKHRRDNRRFADAPFTDEPERTAARIDTSDGVLLFTPDYPDVIPWLPGNQPDQRTRAAERVTRDPEFELALTLSPYAGPGAARLYLRRPAFQVGPEAVGFGGTEGPYPQWRLPIVRWGFGPSSRFTIADGRVTRLMLRAQTPHTGQSMTVAVDGEVVVRHVFRGVGQAEDVVVDLPPARNAGRHVELQYSKWAAGTAADSRKMAVLFLRIQGQ